MYVFIWNLPILGPILQYIMKYKILFYVITGGLLDNMALIFLAGRYCKSLQELIGYTFLLIFISLLMDCGIIYCIKFIFKSSQSSKNIFLRLIHKYGKLLLLVYRFIPFARMPVLSVLALTHNFSSLILYNLYGAVVWSFVFMFSGYYI